MVGQWDSKALFDAVTPGDVGYWSGRSVLDIGANSSGLSVEIARRGARVMAIEPDPYKNNKHLAMPTLEVLVAEERLDMEFRDEELFDAHTLGRFDTVLCLGLIYHFRDPQYVLDYLGGLEHEDLIISTQTHPGSELALVNRKDPAVIPIEGFWKDHHEPLSGWHPTRPLFEKMLESSGYVDVVPLTDATLNFPKKPPGLTNSSYYKASRERSVDLYASRKVFYPR